MKKLVLAPDSFKGTMSSRKICEIMAQSARKVLPDAEIISLPVADGGEGSVDAFVTATGGKKIETEVIGPDHLPVPGFYGLLPDGTAVIEMAAAAGLPLTQKHNPEQATTYGVGQLMLYALSHGAKKMVVCLGGSATNDGGCGAAAACGVKFYDAAGEALIPVGKTLNRIARIDFSHLDADIRKVPIITMCDIDNPLCGKEGAAAVFAPQKGADAAMVSRLDAGLSHLARIVREDAEKEIADAPGAGAAGGMGAGMMAFFNSRLKNGIETVLDTVKFDRQLNGCDLVLTGEGKLDGQSLRGKTVIGVAHRARQHDVPVAAVVGDIGEGVQAVYQEGVSGIFSINRVAVPYEEACRRAEKDLSLTVENLLAWTETVRGK